MQNRSDAYVATATTLVLGAATAAVGVIRAARWVNEWVRAGMHLR